MAHTFNHRVYYSDTDAGGIVYHARYLDMAEHARTELLRTITEAQENQSEIMNASHIGFIVSSLSADYHLPAKLDDLLTVHTSIKQLRRFSLTFIQEVKRGETPIATLSVKVAAISFETEKPIAFPSWFVKEVEQLGISVQ